VSEVEETAKAAQEIAKTAGKVVEAGQKFGAFISRYIHGSLEQGIGIFEDKLKYMRWERQVRLMQRANELIKSFGSSAPSRPIPIKLAVPLLQAASMEDDDYLQDMWAKLLINSADANSDTELKRMYIDILERLTPFEAQILEKIYQLPFDQIQHNGVRTDGLPSTVEAGHDRNPNRKDWQEPSENVRIALISLAHLGCITPTRTWGGGEVFSSVNPTLLGKHFIEACTLRKVVGIYKVGIMDDMPSNSKV
jgi:hypothetical protein